MRTRYKLQHTIFQSQGSIRSTPTTSGFGVLDHTSMTASLMMEKHQPTLIQKTKKTSKLESTNSKTLNTLRQSTIQIFQANSTKKSVFDKSTSTHLQHFRTWWGASRRTSCTRWMSSMRRTKSCSMNYILPSPFWRCSGFSLMKRSLSGNKLGIQLIIRSAVPSMLWAIDSLRSGRLPCSRKFCLGISNWFRRLTACWHSRSQSRSSQLAHPKRSPIR